MNNEDSILSTIESYIPGRNRKKNIKVMMAWTLSLALHLGSLILIAYQGIHSQFGSLEFVDIETDNRVKVMMLELRRKPMPYPPGFFSPKSVASLEELKRRREEEEKKRKRQQEEEKNRKEQEEVARENQSEDAAGANAEEAKPEAPKPQFGRINIHPLKAHVSELYQAYSKGQLQLDLSRLKVTLGFKINEDGSIYDIRIIESSGYDFIDATGVNLLRELGEQRALAPLAQLSSMTLALDIGPTIASARVAGFARGEVGAITLAQQLNGMVLAAKITQANNPDTSLLLKSLEISQTGQRISASLTMPRTMAADLMRKAFGGGM